MKAIKTLKYLFIILFALKMLESLTIFSHGDALNYHLVIPRLVIEYSWPEVFETFFAVFLSGYYELLFFLPNLLFGNTVYTQIFSQLLQFLTSTGLACLLFLHFIKNKRYAFLACLTLLTLSKGGDFLLYAKNDAFLGTLCLWLFFLVTTRKHQEWNPIVIGIFYGLIAGVKLSGLFFLLPISFYIAWFYLKRPFFIIKIIIMAFVTYSPILLIKYHYLGGAIFFPALLGMFPGNLPQSTIDLFNNFTGASITFNSLKQNLGFFFLSKAILILFLPLVYLLRQKKNLLAMSLIVIANFGLVLIVNGGVYSERFLFPMFFTMIAAFYFSLDEYIIPKKYLVLVILIILVDSKIDKTFKRASKVIKYPLSDMHQLRRKEVPLSTIWDHVNIEKDKKFTYLFSDDFVQTFYSPMGTRIDMYPSSPEVFDYRDCQKPEFLNKYKYFIMSWKYKSPCNEIIKSRTNKLYRVKQYDLLISKNYE